MNSNSQIAHCDADARQAELEQLRNKVRDLWEVIHGIGHDMREPVRIITCYSQLLQQAASPDAEAERREYLHFLTTTAQRLDTLVTGILDYARLVGASRYAAHVPVDMNVAVQGALANLQLQMDAAGATIICDDLPMVYGDTVQLTRLIQNLLSNAIKYHGAEPPQILVSVKRRPAEWVFSVRDNGVGIAPLDRERLFLPFNRLHGREIQGNGLGLAICRSIVEQHGGLISVESAPNQGSTFIFTLPVEHPPDGALPVS